MIDIQLRATQDSDNDFLFELYADAYEDQFVTMPIAANERLQMMRLQHQAQEQGHQQQFPGADRYIVETDRNFLKTDNKPVRPIGRLDVNRQEQIISVINIILLREFRGFGIGTRLLSLILEEAKTMQCDIELHVEISNPARLLYQSLGFDVLEERFPYLYMRWVWFD